MGTVPQQYFNFIMDYAPYFYYIPGTGVDTEWGRGPAPAAHAIDFLAEAIQSVQFEDEKTGIYNKIVELADYLLSIQCTDDGKLAYGAILNYLRIRTHISSSARTTVNWLTEASKARTAATITTASTPCEPSPRS